MPQFVQIGNQELKAAWTNPNMFGTSLLVMFLDVYGMDAVQWAAPTIEIEIEQDNGIDLPAGNYDRLMTAIDVFTSNGFFQSVPSFSRDCVVLSGHHAMQNSMVLPDCVDLAWGITEALIIHPPEDNNQDPFSAEVIGYIEEALQSEGILNPPDVLRIASKDQSLQASVNYTWSDDPEMFSAITQSENSKTDDINLTIKTKMNALINQLGSLPLRVGQVKELAQKLLAKLPKTTAPLPLPSLGGDLI